MNTINLSENDTDYMPYSIPFPINSFLTNIFALVYKLMVRRGS